VIPRLVGIGTESSYLVGHMSGPPSLSKTSMPVKIAGGTTGTGAGGGRGVVGAGESMGGGKQKSTLSPHIRKNNVPACTSISAPAVARNGLPRMIGI